MPLVEYDARGSIFHVVNDPFPQGIVEIFDDEGKPYLIFESDVVVDMDTNYIVDGALAERPVFAAPDEIEIIADGSDSASFSIPDPCALRIDGVDHVVEGGQLSISSDMPAEYVIELVQWPYVEKTVKVVAHAAA
jgi:hypothetical protein